MITLQIGPDKSLVICLETDINYKEQEDAARNEWNSIAEGRKTLKTIHRIASKHKIKGVCV